MVAPGCPGGYARVTQNRDGDHHVLAAVGVETDGVKHVLGVRQDSSENAEVATALLADLVGRGLDPARRRLFVIDGSKALRKATHRAFGPQPVQRCRNHKLRNIRGICRRTSTRR